jgi:autotransporter-associated beta strand protein
LPAKSYEKITSYCIVPAKDFFGAGDNVQFDDSVPAVQTNLTIAAGVAVYPSLITNISSLNNFTIGGAGTIGGTAALVKDGSSTLTINTTNSFSGGVTVLNGILRAGSGTALGSTAGTATIDSGATFDDNAQNMGAEQFIVFGAGVGGNGALVNDSATAQESAFQKVTLAGDTTFGGISRWDMRNSSPVPVLNTQGTPCNITKVGTNQVSLVGCNCSDNNLENINVVSGTFAIQTSSTQYGDPNGFVTVSSNAQIEVWGLTAGLDKNILLLDGGQIWSENNQTIISGTVFLTNNAANTAPGTGIVTNDANGTGNSLVLSSTITGPGNLLKTGAGTTELTAANTYTGGTTVAAGTLQVDAGASISTSTNFTIASGATLDVSQISPWSISAGQTLSGSGTVNGSVTISAGATIAPGTPTATGTLTIADGVTLSGNTIMKLNGLTGASDTLSSPGGGNIVLAGSLVISNLNNVAPKIGQTFTLFSTPALSGNFATILPATPGAGLLWSTNNLALNGTITVVAGVATLNFTGAVAHSGNVVSLSGTGGTPGDVYYVLTTTNLALPLVDWTPIATNNFDSTGAFSYSVTNTGTGTGHFYTLEQP